MRNFILSCLMLALLLACAAPGTRKTVDKPKDDADLAIKRFGKPDVDKSSEDEIPKPVFITRMLDYTKERVRFIYVQEKDGTWKLMGTTDPVTNTAIEPEEAVKRLKDRDSQR